ncbi:unnamed protein product [Polarella glacialis]|uniref:Uncharacterized protein n=1 Tax=Polarella glacialis TaxID=89957 RepID=A0A813HGL5_POLGL|nr:unnamed protein product [Polarella glacialis]
MIFCTGLPSASFTLQDMQGSATPEWQQPAPFRNTTSAGSCSFSHQELLEKLMLQSSQGQPWSSAAVEGLSCDDDSDDADLAGCEMPMGALWTKSAGLMRQSSFDFRSGAADDTPGRDGATRSAGGSHYRDPEPEGRGSGSIPGEPFGWLADFSASKADGISDTETEDELIMRQGSFDNISVVSAGWDGKQELAGIDDLHGSASTPEWQQPAPFRNTTSAGSCSFSHQELLEKLMLQGSQRQPWSSAAVEGLSCDADADLADCETPRERTLWTKSAGWMRQLNFNFRSGAADDSPGRDGATRSAGGSLFRDPEPEGRGSGSGSGSVPGAPFGWLAVFSASKADGLSDTEIEDELSVVSVGWGRRQHVATLRRRPCDEVWSSDSDDVVAL